MVLTLNAIKRVIQRVMAMRCASGSEKKKRQLDVLESVILFQRCFLFKAIKQSQVNKLIYLRVWKAL